MTEQAERRGLDHTPYAGKVFNEQLNLINTQKGIQAIIKAARTRKIGDGKVFISVIEEPVRIRTDERGEKAD